MFRNIGIEFYKDGIGFYLYIQWILWKNKTVA